MVAKFFWGPDNEQYRSGSAFPWASVLLRHDDSEWTGSGFA